MIGKITTTPTNTKERDSGAAAVSQIVNFLGTAHGHNEIPKPIKNTIPVHIIPIFM